MTSTAVEGHAGTGRHSPLIPLRRRVDHPRRWLRWVTTITAIAICERCQAACATVERCRPGPTS